MMPCASPAGRLAVEGRHFHRPDNAERRRHPVQRPATVSEGRPAGPTRPAPEDGHAQERSAPQPIAFVYLPLTFRGPF